MLPFPSAPRRFALLGRWTACLVAALVIVTGCSRRQPVEEPPVVTVHGGQLREVVGGPTPIGPTAKLDYTIGDPIVHDNLAIFPVYPKTKPPEMDYLTLDEALAQKVLLVEELPDQQVNRVLVSNRGVKPIYIMAGEIIIGGKQDRTVGKDTIILPHVEKVELEVFCVEEGRWEGRREFEASPAMVPAKIRKAAHVEADQQLVWDGVAESRTTLGAPAAGTSYRGVTDSKEAQARVQPYVEALSARLSQDQKAVGAVVAVNGSVVCADVFNDSRLFQKQQRKLVQSYATEASQQRQTTPVRQPTTGDAGRFISEGVNARAARVEKGQAFETTQREAGGVTAIQTTAPAAAPAPGAPGAAAPQAPVHQSFYRK